MKYLLGLCILACSIAPGFGTTINFDSATGDLGTTHNYGGIAALAYGTGSPDLFGKNDGGDENGVGLTSDPSGEHEITPGGFVQLDLTGITGTVTIVMGSTTDGETYEIFGSSTSGNTTIANVLKTGTVETSFTITPTLRYLDFTSTSGNVLLSSLTYTQTTPEPVTLALTGSGLLGLCLLRRKRVAR